MRISRVIPKIDRAALGSRFEFFRIRSSAGYIKRGARVLDSPVLYGRVEAVVFGGGGSAWAMFPVGDDARAAMREALADSGDSTLSFEPMSAGQVPDRELTELLLASLARARYSDVSGSNLGGRLLVIMPAHMRKVGDSVGVVHALEVGLSSDMALELRVRTFTSLAFRSRMRSRTPIEALPRYELAGGRFMRRTFERGADDPSAFVQRVIGARRYAVPFLDVSNEEAFRASKLGVLSEVLERLEARYGDVLSLGSAEVEDTACVGFRNPKKAEWRKRVSEALGDEEVLVVDSTGDGAGYAELARDAIREMLGVRLRIADAVAPGAAAIRIIHDDSFYGDGADPHDESVDGAVVQHVTAEHAFAAGKARDALLENSVKELAVKLEVVRRKMQLVDWPALGLGGPWCFAIRADDVDGAPCGAFAFLDVSSDGSMAFSLEEPSLLGSGAHDDLMDALALNRDAEAAMRGPCGDVNIVRRTELYTIPDVNGIAAAFKEAGAVSRSRAEVRRLLPDVVEIAYSVQSDGSGLYRVGVSGYGPSPTFARASILREVRTVGSSALLFPDALRLLDVDFVRMRQRSVMPFPFKHLREWLRMEHPELADDR